MMEEGDEGFFVELLGEVGFDVHKGSLGLLMMRPTRLEVTVLVCDS